MLFYLASTHDENNLEKSFSSVPRQGALGTAVIRGSSELIQREILSMRLKNSIYRGLDNRSRFSIISLEGIRMRVSLPFIATSRCWYIRPPFNDYPARVSHLSEPRMYDLFRSVHCLQTAWNDSLAVAEFLNAKSVGGHAFCSRMDRVSPDRTD